jgi:Predicted transmembrane sensor domain
MTFLRRLRRSWPLIVLNFIILVFFLAQISGGVKRWQFIDQMENLAYDARIMLNIETSQYPGIVIVDIDDKSLAAEGRWPWSRIKLSRLLDQLFDHYRAGLVGFDVVFAEPDNSTGLDVLEGLARNELKDNAGFQEKIVEIRPQLDFDNMFAHAMEQRPVVLGFYFKNTDNITSGTLPEPALEREEIGDYIIRSDPATGFGANLPILQEHATGGGHINPTVDIDGVTRRVPLLYEYAGQYYEALSLAMARKFLQVKKVVPVFAGGGTGAYAQLEWLRLGSINIPVDGAAQALVPYRGKWKSFPYVSATDVLQGRAERAVLENRIILVGSSAPALYDQRSTPVENPFPGVEIHANLIAGILDQTIKQRPGYVQGIEFLALLLLGLLMTFLLPLVTPLWAVVIISVLLVLTVYFNLYAWQAGIVLPIASMVLMILAMFLINMSYGFFFERRKKGQITNLFGQYVPRELVTEMSQDPTAYSVAAEEREMSVFIYRCPRLYHHLGRTEPERFVRVDE